MLLEGEVSTEIVGSFEGEAICGDLVVFFFLVLDPSGFGGGSSLPSGAGCARDAIDWLMPPRVCAWGRSSNCGLTASTTTQQQTTRILLLRILQVVLS